MFRAVVEMLTNAILAADLTPSDIRTAAVLACIRYEERRGFDLPVPDEERRAALTRMDSLRAWLEGLDCEGARKARP